MQSAQKAARLKPCFDLVSDDSDSSSGPSTDKDVAPRKDVKRAPVQQYIFDDDSEEGQEAVHRILPAVAAIDQHNSSDEKESQKYLSADGDSFVSGEQNSEIILADEEVTLPFSPAIVSLSHSLPVFT